jgi:hypothetical protein
MCFELLVQIADSAPGRLRAKRLEQLSGLVVTGSRLDEKPALHLSVSGGCSCGFLAQGPNRHGGTWILNPEELPKLEAAIRALNTQAQKYRLVAHWLGGDVERTERHVSGAELLKVVENNQLCDNVVYRTWHDLREDKVVG